MEDVTVFSDGLKFNHQIIGVHFQGNEGEVDSQGFITASLPLYQMNSSSIITRFCADFNAGIDSAMAREL
jgi:hypothetical protein